MLLYIQLQVIIYQHCHTPLYLIRMHKVNFSVCVPHALPVSLSARKESV